jgi:thiamine biosynthesis lipoprotein
MGTLLALTLGGPPSRRDLAARRAFDLAAALERMMSRFDGASDLNRIVASAGRFVRVPAELARALRAARRLAEATGGAFDPTVGPLATAWRRAAATGAAPPRAVLDAARRAVGWRHLQVGAGAVRLGAPGMALDLDGFAKGWAADRIARALQGFGGLSALVNFGESSLRAVGRPPRPGGWPIVVRDLQGGWAGWFTLPRGGCSTSATAPSRPGRAARLPPAIVDPRSGRRLADRAQVTVVARTAAVAEAASTAMLVAGRSAMGPLAARLRAEACWIDDDGIVTTAGFRLRPMAAASRA